MRIMDAYIIGGYRTAVGKAPRGKFRFTRPDDLAANVIQKLMSDFPQIDKNRIDDVIIGNAFPEADQGFNMGRIISLLGLNTVDVPGVTINRYCASGLESIAIGSMKIQTGMADIILAGGAESMSLMPFGGWRIALNPTIGKNNPDWYWGMGLTAEAVAEKYNVSREVQDIFGYQSQVKAVNAVSSGKFKDDIAPITVKEVYIEDNKRKVKEYLVDTDEGPRAETTLEALQKLKPVFAQNGTITAGNASQTSDGAAVVLIVSEKILKEFNLKPLARLVDYQVVGLEPKYMGVGPVFAIPKVLKHAGLTLNQIEQIELNEAFASQSVAILNELQINPEIVNVNGGAIAMGHPLGATGAKLTVQLMNEMRRRKQRYGMVSMCVGTGQGAAGIFELFY